MDLARSVGRLDFVRVWQELTPYELALWKVKDDIDPSGERRADQRTAVSTAAIAAASGNMSGEGAIDSVVESLQTYTPLQRKISEDHFDSFSDTLKILGAL